MTDYSKYDAAVILADVDAIARIADRVMGNPWCGYPHSDRLEWMLDVATVHKHCPLDLFRLEHADDFNFGHDLMGIARHLDRTTGKLGGCFLPRFAVLQK